LREVSGPISHLEGWQPGSQRLIHGRSAAISAFAALAPYALALLLIAIVVAVALTLAGPAIGNVFSSVMTHL